MADRLPRTIRGMARRIAILAVQARALDAGRWLARPSDMTAADMADMAAVAARVNDIMQTAGGRQWDAVMSDLQAATWQLHFGFRGAEQVRDCMTRNGIITTI